MLAASIARLHRERPSGWAAAVAAQATRLALAHRLPRRRRVGRRDRRAARGARDRLDDAIDALHTACYLAEGVSAGPARARRARAVRGRPRPRRRSRVLTAGLARGRARSGATASSRRSPTRGSAGKLDVPLAFEKVAAAMFEALQKGDPARAEKLGRWAVAFDPTNGEAHRNLGLALAQQGKVADALAHLVQRHARAGDADPVGRAVPERQAARGDGRARLREPLVRARRSVADLRRHRVRRDGQPAHRQGVRARLPARSATRSTRRSSTRTRACSTRSATTRPARRSRTTCCALAGDDVMWKTNGWNHLACALHRPRPVRRGRASSPRDAVDAEPAARQHRGLRGDARARADADQAARRRRRSHPVGPPREPVFALLEAGDFAAAVGAGRRSELARAARRARGDAVPVLVGERRRGHAARARGGDRGARRHRSASSIARRCSRRALALQIREQAYFARDPVPRLGDRMTRDAFYQEFRARGGVVLGEDAPPPPTFEDRVVVPGGKVARASDYVALLRDLAALAAARGARAVRSRRRRLPRGRAGVGRGDRRRSDARAARSRPGSRSADGGGGPGRGQVEVRPPSTTSTVPVVNDAASDSR